MLYVLLLFWTSLKHRVREKATSPTASCTYHQKRNEIKTGISGCSSFVVAHFQPATSINRLHGCFWGCCCFVFVLLLLGFLGALGVCQCEARSFLFLKQNVSTGLAWLLSSIVSLYDSSIYPSTIPLFIPLQFLYLSLYNSSVYPSTIPLFISLQFLYLSLYNSSVHPSAIPQFFSFKKKKKNPRRIAMNNFPLFF